MITEETSNPERYQPKITPILLLDKKVWNVYNELQKTVDNLDRKFQLSMKTHQAQFLLAYRAHIHKIKKELEDIKKKSEQQQKMFSSNDRIRYLEKQVALFREEALKLYQAIQKKSLQLQIAQSRIIQAEAVARKMQSENKQIAVQLKKLQTNEAYYVKKIEKLKMQTMQLNDKLSQQQKKRQQQKAMRDYMDSTKQKSSSLGKSESYTQRSITNYQNQLQQWFLECVKTVKKQIHQRKNNFDTLDLNRIANISEFRLVDKLRLFQLLLQNQKLLNWLYHKIFPDRFDNITLYLSSPKTIPLSQTDLSISNEGANESRYSQGIQQLELPKIISKKTPSLRNRITIKNGKMNISFN